VDRRELIDFVRARGLAVVATCGPDGSPQAALVGLAATDRGELIFDCSRRSRKYVNIERDPQAAIVIGWDDEITVQIEGTADILAGADLERCLAAYLAQYPNGRERAGSERIARIRIQPRWLRYSDYRPESFNNSETEF
jgi:PPOX class probable F420-dependent enzyme